MTKIELLEKRRALGLTQQQLADILQITVRTVRRWEAGDTEIPHLAEIVINNFQPARS